MKSIKKVFISILLLLLLVNSSFALSINIFGEVNEYSKIYSEVIVVGINCSESLNLTLPTGAINIYFGEKPISTKQISINNCNSKNIIKYNLDKLEFLSNGNQRIERNFGRC